MPRRPASGIGSHAASNASLLLRHYGHADGSKPSAQLLNSGGHTKTISAAAHEAMSLAKDIVEARDNRDHGKLSQLVQQICPQLTASHAFMGAPPPLAGHGHAGASPRSGMERTNGSSGSPGFARTVSGAASAIARTGGLGVATAQRKAAAGSGTSMARMRTEQRRALRDAQRLSAIVQHASARTLAVFAMSAHAYQEVHSEGEPLDGGSFAKGLGVPGDEYHDEHGDATSPPSTASRAPSRSSCGVSPTHSRRATVQVRATLRPSLCARLDTVRKPSSVAAPLSSAK